jgi:Zn-dependent protease with chaperone function
LCGAEVTPTQFPAIYQVVQELCKRFQVPQTRVFVIRKKNPEAQTLGFRAPYVVVLPSLLLDSLEPDQLRFVLGQALGHIRFGHTRMAILLGGDQASLPAVFSWVAQIRDLVFAGYHRAQVFSADRAGILACRSVRMAIRIQTKLSVGNIQIRDVREDGLIDQAYKLTRGMSRLQARLVRLQSRTPPLIRRLEVMVEWAGLPSREPGMNPHRGVDEEMKRGVMDNKEQGPQAEDAVTTNSQTRRETNV